MAGPLEGARFLLGLLVESWAILSFSPPEQLPGFVDWKGHTYLMEREGRVEGLE